MKRLAAAWTLAVCMLSAATVWAIDLSDLHLDYLETFTGETALPTTLETNSRGLGNLFASAAGNAGAPALPSVNQRVHFSVAGIDGPQPSQAQVIALDAKLLDSNTNVAVRATFDSLMLVNVTPALEAVSVGLGFDSAGKVTAPDVVIGASLSRVQLSSPNLWAFEIDLSKVDGTFTNLSFQILPSAMQTAIASGAAFDLVLRFDRATKTVRAGLTAAGQDLSSTPVVVADAALPIVTASAAAQVLNADPSGASLGSNDSMQVDLRRFELDVASLPNSVPALAPRSAAILAAGLLLIGLAALRARGTAGAKRDS